MKTNYCKCGCGEISPPYTYYASSGGRDIKPGDEREYLPGHKPRKKTALVWTISREELIQIINTSESTSEVLDRLDAPQRGGQSYYRLLERLEQEGLDKSILPKGGITPSWNKKPLEEVLVKNSTYSRAALKSRVIREDLLDYKCQKCGLVDSWNGDPLKLHLDHINGVRDDNRLVNLRFLCPNCHSQTDTSTGKRLKKKYYCECGNTKWKTSPQCAKCFNVNRVTKIEWPPADEVWQAVEEHGFLSVGEMLGVSDNAVRKFLKRSGFSWKPRKYTRASS